MGKDREEKTAGIVINNISMQDAGGLLLDEPFFLMRTLKFSILAMPAEPLIKLLALFVLYRLIEVEICSISFS